MRCVDEMLGPYRLIARIGAGGMGEVWKAEDPRLGRFVAIKILPPQVSSDAEAIARMRREARTAAQLYHPNIATIHSFEEADGRTFIVMELVEGEPLSALIARGAMSESEVCRIGRGVADALAEAHEHGIVHRDIKPDNVIVRGQRVKVLDFGIAKRLGVESAPSNDPTTFMTQQGMIVGTVHYMSPEQALGKTLDARTDIFSLGVVLYQAATGKLPFRGETITETITQIIRDEPASPRVANPSITPSLALLIERCMKKNRDERIGSAVAVSKELERLMAVVPTEAMTAEMTAPMTAQRVAAVPTVIDRAPAPGKRARWPGIVALLVLAGGIAMAWDYIRRDSARQPHYVVTTTTAQARDVATTTTAQDRGVAASDSAKDRVVEVTDTTPHVAANEPPPTPRQEQPTPATGSIAVETASAPPPQQATGIEHLRLGELALSRRNMQHAAMQFQKALDSGELDARQTLIANLGLAITRDDRAEAVRIAREIRRTNPGDRELAAIHREFGPWFGRVDEPPQRVPRRRWPR